VTASIQPRRGSPNSNQGPFGLRSVGDECILRKLTFFGHRCDPLKKRILPHHAPCPSFSYCLANNQGSYPEKRLPPG
jgi:hypothetical protein